MTIECILMSIDNKLESFKVSALYQFVFAEWHRKNSPVSDEVENPLKVLRTHKFKLLSEFKRIRINLTVTTYNRSGGRAWLISSTPITTISLVWADLILMLFKYFYAIPNF